MKTRKQRGVLLVFVLGTAMLIGVIGVSALLAARLEYRGTADEAEAAAAQWCASAAIEIARQHIADDVNWRTVRGGGTWYTNQACGPGTFSLSVALVADADTDPTNDPCNITAIGRCGNTMRQIQVTLKDGWELLEQAPVVSTVVP